jgi:hypothetical protein
LKTIALASDGHSAKVLHAGKPIAASVKREGERVLLTLKNSVNISAGEKLEIILNS